MSYAVPKTCGNSTAEWKWHPKTPKKAKKHQKCHIFPGFQKIPVPYFFVNCFRNVPHRRFKWCMNRQWYVFFDLDFVLHHCGQCRPCSKHHTIEVYFIPKIIAMSCRLPQLTSFKRNAWTVFNFDNGFLDSLPTSGLKSLKHYNLCFFSFYFKIKMTGAKIAYVAN